jgi:hypothetical protein
MVVVDTVYRKFKMTARAMEQQFGPEQFADCWL